MKKLIIKIGDGIKIIYPNLDKFGDSYQEIKKIVSLPVFHEGYHLLDEEGNPLYEEKELIVGIIKPWEEWKGLQKYIDSDHPQFVGEICEWFITDEHIDKSDLESRKQLYCDGQKIKKDLEWKIRLMPDQLIKRKHLNKLHSKIDEELEKQNPDSIALMKLHQEREFWKSKKCGAHNDCKETSKLALKNLDKKVSDGEPDKPVIRQKLLAKIAELTAKENGG